MSTKKYVSLEKLGVYHGKITGVIADGDAKALSDAKAYVDEKTSGIATNENLGALTERVTTAEGEIAAIKEDVNAFFLDADMTESAKDTLKELQTYIASDETAASQMAASIKENADAIDALEGAGYLVADDVANKADKGTTLEAYGIADAYTSAQTDTAIENAIAQFVEVSDEEIDSLFA